MAYIGRQLVRGQNRVLDDISSSFNGSTTAFNLTVSSSSSPPASVNQLWIILGGVLQKPGTDFTVADAVITFTTAPASTLNFWGMIQGDTSDINSPADASVTPSKIANSGDFAFPADVRFNDADGSHYVGLQAPSTVSSNLVWTLPAADGSANQLLKTDGSGALGWASDANAPEGTSVLSTGETGTTKYLRVDGDNTCSWQLAVDATKATLTGSTNNTICTVTGANSIAGEANLTFDGTLLKLQCDSGEFRVEAANGVDAFSVDSDNGNTVIAGELDLTGKCLTSFGGNSTNEAACIKVGYEGSSKGQIRVYGADASTTGSLEFKVCESDGTDDHSMLLDGSGRLLLGTTTEGNESADELTISNSGNTGITIRSTDSSNCSLFFSDATSGASEYTGYVQYIHSNNSLKFGTATAERLVIDSSGALGLGITPKDNDGNYRQLQIGLGAHFYGRTDDTPVYISSNGYRDGNAWKYTANTTASRIAMATNMTFKTAVSGTADNAISWSERMTIFNTGDVQLHAGNLVVASGKGIDFSATANSSGTTTAELLDDYEYGSFTPFIEGSSTGGTVAYSAQNGFYVKIGRLVQVYVDFTVSSWSGAAGNQRIGGFPFTKNELSGQGYYYEGVAPWYVMNNLTNSTSNYQGYIGDNATLMNIYVGDTCQTDTAGPVNVTGRASFSFTYSTSS